MAKRHTTCPSCGMKGETRLAGTQSTYLGRSVRYCVNLNCRVLRYSTLPPERFQER